MAGIEHASLTVARVNGTLHARISGPVDRNTAPLLQQQLSAEVAGGCRVLSLDLVGAEYLDSDGVRWLQRLAADLAACDVDLRLNLRERSPVERTLRLLGLEEIFVIERSAA